MTEAEALHVLGQRRDWLTARIAAKRSIGWDVEWDTRERDALALVLRAAGAAVPRRRAEGGETPDPPPNSA